MVELQMSANQAISNSDQYDQKLAEANTQIALLNSITDYMNEPSHKYETLPANIGISDQSAVSLINKYNEIVLERNRLLRSASENSPTVTPLTSQLDDLSSSIRRAMAQAKRSMDIQRNAVASQYGKYNSMIQQTPEQEKTMKQIGRQLEVKAGLYLMLLQKREENSISLAATADKGKLIDELFGEKCEGSYIQPTFITDYPKEMSPLTKEHRTNPLLTERFELMVNGKELANAYSELNDPIDQRERFEDQLRLSEKGDDEAMFIDADFLRALEYGMPPTSGMGIGMDRLVMLLTGQESIQEVLLFPQMRPEKVLPRDKKEVFTSAGIPEEWVPVLHKAGYLTLAAVKDEDKPGRLLQQLMDLKKKYKLELPAITLDEVTAWTK